MKRYINRRHPMPGDEARKRGEKVCRWCVKPLTKRRSTWCSDACAGEYMVRSSGNALRAAVHHRDKGVCTLCKIDTDAIMAQAYALYWGPDNMRRRYEEAPVDSAGLDAMRADLKARGFPHLYATSPGNWRSLWDADHIVPVVDGAGACGIENMRTLCVPCHKRETAALAARRAEERRAKKQAGDGTLFGGAA